MGDLDRRLYTSHPAVAYQRPLVNPYRMFDPQQARQRQGNPGSRAFPVTCSWAGIDLPGFERRVPSPNRYMAFARFCFCKNNKRTIDRHGLTDMSDQEDTPVAQTARGGSSSRGSRALRDDDR